MYRTMLKSKIHRVTVTQADLHYVGSVTVDEDLMEAADLLPGEQVSIVDVTNGARLETYVIKGERGSGVLGINGAAAYRPRVVFVDADNRIVHRHNDPGHAPEGSGLLSGTVTLPPEEETAVFPVAETADARRLDALLHAES